MSAAGVSDDHGSQLASAHVKAERKAAAAAAAVAAAPAPAAEAAAVAGSTISPNAGTETTADGPAGSAVSTAATSPDHHTNSRMAPTIVASDGSHSSQAEGVDDALDARQAEEDERGERRNLAVQTHASAGFRANLLLAPSRDPDCVSLTQFADAQCLRSHMHRTHHEHPSATSPL